MIGTFQSWILLWDKKAKPSNILTDSLEPNSTPALAFLSQWVGMQLYDTGDMICLRFIQNFIGGTIPGYQQTLVRCEDYVICLWKSGSSWCIALNYAIYKILNHYIMIDEDVFEKLILLVSLNAIVVFSSNVFAEDIDNGDPMYDQEVSLHILYRNLLCF